MSYQVLARKWRPRTFEEVVGQSHVLRALVNALEHGRLHHAYLFTGTRGVGKTTLGRILAKSLNCEQGVTPRPCGQCATCREIDEGRFVDLMEVDAASRTKVEDTRELLENVQYPPVRGRYKVYLIDEVHMLSGHSFNALLKTLEEPPEHVKFLLATTDPQKLPVTVLSRCLRFNLKRIPKAQIQSHLAHILRQEGIDFEDDALARLAQAADGSLRDALSLLDQAIAFGGGAVRDQAVRDMLGDLDPAHLHRLLEALATNDGPTLLAAVEALGEQGADHGQALEGLIGLLHRIAVCQVVPEAPEEDPWVREMAQRLPPEEVQLHYQIAIESRRDLPLATDPRIGFEMALLRMLAFRPAEATTAPSAPPQDTTEPTRTGAEAVRAALARRPSPPEDKASAPPKDPPPPPADTAPTEGDEVDWQRLASEVLPLSGAARQLAMNCVWGGMTGNEVRLLHRPGALLTEGTKKGLERALSQHFGRPLKLRLEAAEHTAPTPAQAQEAARRQRLAEAQAALRDDPGVQALAQTFDAVVEEDSIRPTDPASH